MAWGPPPGAAPSGPAPGWAPPGPGPEPSGSGYQPPGYQPPGYQQPGFQPPGHQSPGYQQPGYQPPGYQQGPNWGPGPAPGTGPGPGIASAPGPASGAPRARGGPSWATIEPAWLASLAISAGVVVLFLANFLVALGQPTGTPGNARMLQFLSPADVSVAAILIVAVALVVLVPSSGDPTASPQPTALTGANVRSVAGFVAGAVAAAAFVRAIVALTISHERALLKLGTMVDALAAVVVAAAGAYWALKPKLSK